MNEPLEGNQTDETAKVQDGEASPDLGNEGGETPPAIKFYSAEELENLHPTAVDLERVDPAARPIVEKTIKEYKSLQADHTKKSQELKTLKEVKPEEEKYFSDQNKDQVFRDYLKTPMKVLGDINSEIAKLEAVIPEDGADEYRSARRTIAQWQAIKDEFREKKSEVQAKTHQDEVAEAKLVAELGEEAPALLEYAKELGYSERDFKSKSSLREALKKTYALAHASEKAKGKEVKTMPHKAAAPSGGSSGGSETQDPVFKDDNAWFAHQQKLKRDSLRKSLGG